MINRWISAHCGPHGLQRHSLTHHSLHHGLQGSHCFGTWGTFSRHSSGCLQSCSSQIFSLLSSDFCWSVQVLPSLLNYIFREVLPPSLQAWPWPAVALSWSRLASLPPGASHSSNVCGPLTTRTLPHKPNMKA